ncbi:hypothetical protein GMAR_ORF296 [Golden Marseillevirus]|uniref:hypothetical protein n=1 Tax=Golden Marseillevirus TaxID=1720526 RepID=UPI000877ABD0|nr:hypothetical protein GMAR_ORF296 [Golden Marseillevirus]ALX27670.1 hypothetical protein GMAR_ORF296 [Golden Marseillevirus]
MSPFLSRNLKNFFPLHSKSLDRETATNRTFRIGGHSKSSRGLKKLWYVLSFPQLFTFSTTFTTPLSQKLRISSHRRRTTPSNFWSFSVFHFQTPSFLSKRIYFPDSLSVSVFVIVTGRTSPKLSSIRDIPIASSFLS